MKTSQKRCVVHKEYWPPCNVAEAYATPDGVKVVVAADRMEMFDGSEAFRLARRTARRNGCLKFETSGRTRTCGNAALVMKDYYFKR